MTNVQPYLPLHLPGRVDFSSAPVPGGTNAYKKGERKFADTAAISELLKEIKVWNCSCPLVAGFGDFVNKVVAGLGTPNRKLKKFKGMLKLKKYSKIYQKIL